MEKESTMFDRIFMEADDAPPDMPAETQDAPADMGGNDPPDMGVEDQSGDAPDDMGGGMEDPPDLSDDGGGDFSDDNGMDDESNNDSDNSNNIEFDEKISRIMNMNLYQRYLALLNNINGQLTMLKDNSDVLYAVSEDSLDIISALKKLDENVRLYLKDYFIQENFSKNRLFFDKCLNLLNLLNEIFQKKIEKGIKHVK